MQLHKCSSFLPTHGMVSKSTPDSLSILRQLSLHVLTSLGTSCSLWGHPLSIGHSLLKLAFPSDAWSPIGTLPVVRPISSASGSCSAFDQGTPMGCDPCKPLVFLSAGCVRWNTGSLTPAQKPPFLPSSKSANTSEFSWKEFYRPGCTVCFIHLV